MSNIQKKWKIGTHSFKYSLIEINKNLKDQSNNNQYNEIMSESSRNNYDQKEDGSKYYTLGKGTLILSNDGTVKKKGKFSFEKEEINEELDQSKAKLIDFKNDSIKSIKCGTNHILFLSTKGNVYSLGDNNYGQLGINNKMIPTIYEPELIKFEGEPLQCKWIYAFEYNSFAIDMNSRLYIWGKSDYLLGVYNTNLFEPKQFLTEFKIVKIAHSINENNDDIMNIFFTNNHNEDYDYNEEEEEKKEIPQEDNNINDISNKKEIVSNKEDPFFNSKENNESKNIDQENADFSRYLEEISEFTSKISSNEKFLADIRAYCLNEEYSFLEKENIKKIWDEIQASIKTAVVELADHLVKKRVAIKFMKILELFSFLFRTNIQHFYEYVNFPLFKTLQSDYIKLYNDKQNYFLTEEKNSQNNKQFFNNIYTMLANNTKYKLLQNTIYQFSIHQYIYKVFDLDKIIKVLSDVLATTLDEIETKAYLIEQIYENILIASTYYTKSIENAPLKEFEDISKNEFDNEDDVHKEQLMFQCLIDINKSIKDLWMYYTFHSKEKIIMELKTKEIDNIYSVFNDIYKIKKEISDNLNSEVYTNNKGSLQTNFVQVEKCQTKLKNLCYDKINNSHELTTRQMIGYYTIAVLEEMKYKKILINLTAEK